jgi:hypothetical protein
MVFLNAVAKLDTGCEMLNAIAAISRILRRGFANYAGYL